MAHGDVLTTDAEIEAALARARQFDAIPRVFGAEYDPDVDGIVLKLSNHRRLIVSRGDFLKLAASTPERLAKIEIYAGLSLALPQLDIQHHRPYILQDSFGYVTLMQEVQQEKVAA